MWGHETRVQAVPGLPVIPGPLAESRGTRNLCVCSVLSAPALSPTLRFFCSSVDSQGAGPVSWCPSSSASPASQF